LFRIGILSSSSEEDEDSLLLFFTWGLFGSFWAAPGWAEAPYF
jgi:hypothetical protein